MYHLINLFCPNSNFTWSSIAVIIVERNCEKACSGVIMKFFAWFIIFKLSWTKISRVPDWHFWGFFLKAEKQNGRHRLPYFLFCAISSLLMNLQARFWCLVPGFLGQGNRLRYNKRWKRNMYGIISRYCSRKT